MSCFIPFQFSKNLPSFLFTLGSLHSSLLSLSYLTFTVPGGHLAESVISVLKIARLAQLPRKSLSGQRGNRERKALGGYTEEVGQNEVRASLRSWGITKFGSCLKEVNASENLELRVQEKALEIRELLIVFEKVVVLGARRTREMMPEVKTREVKEVR